MAQLNNPGGTNAEDEEKTASQMMNSAAGEMKEEETPASLNPQLFVIQSCEARHAGSRANPEDSSASPTASEPERDEDTYPEGGREAWLVVLGSWLALVASLGLMNTIGTFNTYLSTHQLAHLSEGTVGWIFSLYTFLAFFLGVYIGPLFDKHGPRWLVAAGTALLFAGLMLFSAGDRLWHFVLSFGVLCGAASALLFTPSFAAVGHFFRARRGFATGLAATGGGVGGVAFPLLLQALLPRLGWAWSVRVLALLCLVLAGASNLLLRSRLRTAAGVSARPDVRIFAGRAFALTTLGTFLLEFAMFVPLGFVSLYALSKGFDEAFSFRILTVLNASSVVGRVLPGWYADRIGAFNANIAGVVLSIVACMGVWLPAGGSTAGLVMFVVLFGFASGSNISLTPVCIGRLCETVHYGRYYATCYTVVSVACLVGIPIAGNILASNGGDYWGLILFTGLIYVGSLVALLAAKVSCVGWRPWTTF